MIGFLRASIRFFLFASFTFFLATIGLIKAFIQKGKLDAVYGLFHTWSLTVRKILGIQLEIRGKFPETRALILPNHRSYIDTAPFPGLVPVSFVAKIEVSRWPVIGYSTKVVNTVYVDRNDPQSRRKTRQTIQKRLEDGFSVVVFPEGTTAKAPEIKPLRPGMFHIAADGNIPVVPVAIEYADPDDAFIGDDTFVPNFFRVFKKPVVAMRMSIGPVMNHEDGEVLRQQVYDWIVKEAAILREGFTREAVSTS